MKKIINENQKGLLFKNGKFTGLLGAGKYNLFKGKEIEVLNMDSPVTSSKCTLDMLLSDEKIKKQTFVIEVLDQHLALLFEDGIFKTSLTAGKYAFWQAEKSYEYKIADISSPDTAETIDRYIFDRIPMNLYHKFEVAQYQKGILYFDNKFQRILDAGTYYFWRTNVKVDVKYVDTRLTQAEILGQEILTQDKVTIRVNFVCNYRITDYVKIYTEIDDYMRQMYVAAQLALRDFVGKHKLDDILENKKEMSEYVCHHLKQKEKDLFVEFYDADVKDIILPGEIRDIMNTVIAAEKKAQANIITRREEVASTRSLLNTAKLMEENKTLYKLKELEYIERICENVGNINLNAGGDILAQLAGVLHSS